MEKRILILEDLAVPRKSLVNMVKECGEDLLVYDFGDLAGALECAMENKIDLFFVDIVLKPKEPNDHSGIVFAKSIRENAAYRSAEIVFITSIPGLEAELMRSVHCFDYIEKPISKDRVHRVVKEALLKLDGRHNEDEMVFLRKDRITYPVFARNIVFAENRRRTLCVHTTNEQIEIPNLSLKKFIEKIQTQEFLYPTRGIATNVNYIEYIDSANRYVKMRGIDQPIDIGQRMRDKFLNDLYKHKGGENR